MTQPPPALQALWYARLRASGFRDLETRRGVLADRHAVAYAVAMDPLVRQANAEYFDLAAQYLLEADWPGVGERRIWELHSDGATVREIAKAAGRSKDAVQRVIRRHRKVMLASRG